MRRQEEEQEKENSERWLLTYSDMITLLMIFFIIMYTMSSVNEAKFQALAESLNITLEGGTGMFDSTGPSMMKGTTAGTTAGETAGTGKTEAQMLSDAQKELETYLKAEGLYKNVTLKSEERGLVISFQEMILFPGGQANLTPQARAIMAKVATTISKLPNYIRVEGHTCDLPISNGAYASNWELSSARALTVVHEFMDAGKIAPQRLSATAYSEYRPRKPNDSEQNRAQNRRVDIVVLNSKYIDIEPGYHDIPGSKLEEPGAVTGPAFDEDAGTEASETETDLTKPPKVAPEVDTTYVP